MSYHRLPEHMEESSIGKGQCSHGWMPQCFSIDYREVLGWKARPDFARALRAMLSKRDANATYREIARKAGRRGRCARTVQITVADQRWENFTFS